MRPDRHRQWHALCFGTTGPRFRAGATICLLHRGLQSSGTLVTKAWSEDSSDAIDLAYGISLCEILEERALASRIYARERGRSPKKI
jgi:hypothetical protein